MPPDAPTAALPGLRALRSLSPGWRAGLFRLSLGWGLLLVLFRRDWADMFSQWWNISTYNHVLLVPLIVAWLVWQRLPEVRKLEPTVWWPGLLLATGSILLWVLGALSGVATARHLGVVAAMMASVTALLGPRVSAGLLFPLAYMLFLVPIGEELVPLLQMITAKITIALVHVSGIEAVINGVFIDTPAGLFEVAEACSGVKFLIAMIAFGVLVGNVCFRAWRRRVLFLLACVIVPVLANGVRAWGTIYAAQYVGVEAAAGFDHLIYGWVFFALVLGMLIAGAWHWFDRPASEIPVDAAAIAASAWLGRLEAMRAGPVLAMALLAGPALGALGWARAADSLSADIAPQIWLPDVPGWERADYAPAVWWEPQAVGANHRLLGRYQTTDGLEVDVFVAVYAAQHEGREAGGYGQGAVPPDSVWAWQSPGPDAAPAQSDQMFANGQVTRLALTYYRTGDLLTGAKARLSLATLADRLMLRPRPTTVLILSTEISDREKAELALATFRKDAGPLDRWMDRTAGLE